MGTSRHYRAEVVPRLLSKGGDNLQDAQHQDPHFLAKVASDQSGYLIIPGTPGPQTSPELRADDLLETAFERTMHVLVGRCWHKLTGGDAA